jgi:hypothetical protein
VPDGVVKQPIEITSHYLIRDIRAGARTLQFVKNFGGPGHEMSLAMDLTGSGPFRQKSLTHYIG